MLVHTKELTLRVRANEKVVASVSLLGVIACTFIGAGYFAPKAEACSPRLDGEPTYCPPWDDDVAVCLSLDCPRKAPPLYPRPDITDQSFEDELNPSVFNQGTVVTLYDTREHIAHMGHDFPTWPTAGEMIQAIREEEARKNRNSIDDMLNSALEDMEINYGSNGSTESEELLQLSSDRD